MTTSSEDEFDQDDCIPTETPFDPKQGIWFKYGRLYQDAKTQIADFEGHLDVKLPEDFLGLIGENCEGGFDGWYQVMKDDAGSLIWTHLLLMKLPDLVDEKRDGISGQEECSHITTRILDSKRELFFKKDRLALMPFGTASRIHPEGTGTDGFLAFDINNGSRIVFVHRADIDPVFVSESFSTMMTASVFQFFG